MPPIEAAWKTDEFAKSPSGTLVPLGVDEFGKYRYADLRDMYDILIAGKVCAGKSTFLQGLIKSLLSQNTPETLRLILHDPKKVEFIQYEKNPYLLFPVLYKAQECLKALQWCMEEVERRFLILTNSQKRNVHVYNETAVEKLPVIVFVIEEFADLMYAYPKEATNLYVRIAQMTKAMGIYFVICLQREDPDVYNSLIMANAPTRIAFRAVTREFSEYFLGVPGAEVLTAPGGMMILGLDDEVLTLQGFSCLEQPLS